MANTLDQILARWVHVSSNLVGGTPLHLLSEQEFRQGLAMILVDLDSVRFSQPEHLQFEKAGSGVPARRPIDLYFETETEVCFVEFKYWHTMVKVRDHRRQLGKGNNTHVDVKKWINDYDKLLRIENTAAKRWFLLVAQASQYPGSSSRLPFDVLESRRPALSPRLIAQSDQSSIQLPTGVSGTATPLFLPADARSPEGIQFGIYGIELSPA